jgi:hypothetical protein
MAGLVSVKDSGGTERLFAGYAKVDVTAKPIEAGVSKFNDLTQMFERVVTDYNEEGFVRPDGHAFKFQHGMSSYVYYPGRLRIPATAEAMVDRKQYEQFSAYGADGSPDLVKAPDGTLQYAFRPGAKHVTSDALTAAGVGADQSLDGHTSDVVSGKDVTLIAASQAWNRHRARFLQIAQQQLGDSSALGELFHAEADTPMGPWVYARKIITHDKYTFYNPFLHPEFDLNGGRTIFLEGTYTSFFAGPQVIPTPRYDYNQIMYRLNLEDTRLVLPVAVYDVGTKTPGQPATKRELRRSAPALAAAFFAPDRPAMGTVPVAWSAAACAPRSLVIGGSPPTEPVFYALPPDTSPVPPHAVPLYDYASADGHHAYSVDPKAPFAGMMRADKPVALVWENPIRVAMPVADYLGDLVANAGDDQCVPSVGQGGGTVVLDGSASDSVAGQITKYIWHLPPGHGCDFIEGKQVHIALPKGSYSIELVVTDSAGNVSTDSVLVTVT